MSNPTYKPDRATLQRIEELLVEQLEALGENPRAMQPHEISQHMVCGVHESGSLLYTWRGKPLLRVVPEKTLEGTILWRMFTADETIIPVQ